jgi:hypothetical protein
MTKKEIAALLGLIAGADGRQPDALMAEAWYAVLDGMDITFPQAREKVLAFYRAGHTRRIQIGDITAKKKITEQDGYNIKRRDLFGERRRWQAAHPNGTAAEFAKWYEATDNQIEPKP